MGRTPPVRSGLARRRLPLRAPGIPALALAAAFAGLPAACTPPRPAQPVERAAPSTRPAAIDGFTDAAARRQRERERLFLSVPSPEGAAETGRWLAATPHMAGTPAQAALTDSLAGWLAGLGFEVEVERWDVWLPHPESLALELVEPRARTFALRERSGAPAGPYAWSWNAYSADGEARGAVVYANYGRADDFRVLRERGVEVAGRIVLARYGGVFRGVKVREAEARGAAGVVLFPDPADDGFVPGDTVPLGPYRPAGSVQRGTVSYLWRYPGDPLTPGRPARPGVPRLDPDSALNLPTIPVLNISAAQAREILGVMDGPEAPEGFRGGWPEPYRLGGPGAVLRLSVRQRYRQRPVRNVLARLPGREAQSVVVGVHVDAWGRGGVDPQSGVGAVLEIGRGLAALRSHGWRPRRELVLAFWGAEEFGAVGSTEFVEAHGDWLDRRAVAYLNVDVLTAGSLDVSGSPSLRDLVWAVAGEVEDPVAGGTLADRWRERGEGAEGETDRPVLGPLGVGSDWTAFFHHAGVPSLQWTMNGRGTYAVYHSALDDYDYLRVHADSALLYTPQMARVMGLAALRLAEADALPFDYGHYARRVTALVDSALARRPAMVPDRAIASLRDALEGLRDAADAVGAARSDALARNDTAALRRMNLVLPRVEAAFLVGGEPGESDGGGRDPGRSWYRHALLTSDPATGYGTIPVPALGPAGPGTEGADGRGVRSVQELERALRRAAARLRRLLD